MIVRLLRLLAVLLFAAPLAAQASAVVQAISGDVRVGGAPVFQDQRVFRGASVTTGQSSRVVLRFDDGGQVILDQNTEFRIADFQYGGSDRSVFDLVKGALRVISGAIGRRSPESFALRTPQMTIGVRGTDFMVAIVNPAYTSVLQGSIAATNAAGTVVFGQGTAGVVANSATLPAVIPAAQLPAAASFAFTNLANVNLAAGGAAFGGAGGPSAGASPVAGAAQISRPVATALIFGAIAVGVAAIIASDDDKPTTTHH